MLRDSTERYGWGAWALLWVLLLGCSRGPDGGPPILGKGSDTMVNLAQAWAEAYATAQPGVQVEVSGGGSGVGIAALIRGSADLANSSRDLKPAEAESAHRATGKAPREYIVGYDALGIYVHRDNPLDAITFGQLRELFAVDGRITKWSELGVRIPGSRHDEIVRVGRQSSGGTFEFLRHRVLNDRDFRLGTLELNGSKEVVELIANTPTAIGYSGMGFVVPGVKLLRVAERAGEEAVAPTPEATVGGRYPISRSLLVYALGEPRPEVREYLAWILSDAGQAWVPASGFVPVPPQRREPAGRLMEVQR
jgi:phosphate transport system substrate-binding protein